MQRDNDDQKPPKTFEELVEAHEAMAAEARKFYEQKMQDRRERIEKVQPLLKEYCYIYNNLVVPVNTQAALVQPIIDLQKYEKQIFEILPEWGDCPEFVARAKRKFKCLEKTQTEEQQEHTENSEYLDETPIIMRPAP